MMPVGARLAEMARLRLRYDDARRQVQEIQQVAQKRNNSYFSKTNIFVDFLLKELYKMNRESINAYQVVQN